MPIVGAYELHLYCDTKGCENGDARVAARGEPVPFESDRCQTRGEALQQARRAGWTVNWARGTCRCPKCSQKPTRRRNA